MIFRHNRLEEVRQHDVLRWVPLPSVVRDSEAGHHIDVAEHAAGKVICASRLNVQDGVWRVFARYPRTYPHLPMNFAGLLRTRKRPEPLISLGVLACAGQYRTCIWCPEEDSNLHASRH